MSESLFHTAFLHGAVPEHLPQALQRHQRGEFDPVVADLVCERLADGVPLRKICDDERLPSRSTVMRWVRTNPDFRAEYFAALYWRTQQRADEIIEIADDDSGDFQPVQMEDGPPVLTFQPKAIQRAKMQIESRKWLLAKELPSIYGDVPVGFALPSEFAPPSTAPPPVEAPDAQKLLVSEHPMQEQIDAWKKARELTVQTG